MIYDKDMKMLNDNVPKKLTYPKNIHTVLYQELKINDTFSEVFICSSKQYINFQ